MNHFRPFELERWQSTHENDVELNLSESGVHPLTLGELRALCAHAPLDDVLLGYGQTNGTLALRERIARLYPGASPDNVTIATGSAEANFAAVWTLARAGEGIAVLVPTYMQTPGVAAAFGARVTTIPLREELGWQPDPDELRSVMRTGMRALVVTNPCNPTGTVLSPQARSAIVDAAAQADAWIIADEVYAGAELHGAVTPSFFGDYPRTIATGSLSKAYGLPGLRIGWAVTTPEMAEQLWTRRDYTTIAPAVLSDHLAVYALDTEVRTRLLARTRRLIHEGLDVVRPWLEQQPLFRWRVPDAGAILLARYDAPIDDVEIAERLRVEHSVLIVPGTHFGIPRALRFGLGLPAAQLRTALDRLSGTLAAMGVDAAVTG